MHACVGFQGSKFKQRDIEITSFKYESTECYNQKTYKGITSALDAPWPTSKPNNRCKFHTT